MKKKLITIILTLVLTVLALVGCATTTIASTPQLTSNITATIIVPESETKFYVNIVEWHCMYDTSMVKITDTSGKKYYTDSKNVVITEE